MGRSSQSHRTLVEELNIGSTSLWTDGLLTDNLVVIRIRDLRCGDFVCTQQDIKTFSESYTEKQSSELKDRREEKPADLKMYYHFCGEQFVP